MATFQKYITNQKTREKFPNSLKTADITPIHKEKDKTIKKNDSPISILPTLSKLYKGNMNGQISF